VSAIGNWRMLWWWRRRFGRHSIWRNSLPWARDPVCGLPMFRQWRRHVSRLLWQRRGFALVIFDFDHMKSLNYFSGHGKGDRALQQIAFEVRRAVPEKARIYKVGGDELAVLLPGMNEQQAYNWAETVRKAVEAEVRVVNSKQESRSVTVRAGVTEHLPTKRLWSKKDQTPLIMATNAALAEAAARGGNCVVTRPVVAVLESEG
jgi:diguanylate cyclase (GGDEF)-like protein